jgi:hypothetical protein
MDFVDPAAREVIMRHRLHLRRLIGLLLSAALVAAPLLGHAEQTVEKGSDVLAVLSLTCLGGDADDGTGDHDSQAGVVCHACPAGCFSGCAMLCDAGDTSVLQGRDGIRITDLSRGLVASVGDLHRARSPPRV